ncbi:MAG: glutathione peroxidase [Methylovirgula sp.]|uniref:glutathione peroxidase n=1 Tax=Methylovirgula sp. TaxID=1978224 RepID=UPI00307639F0
MASIYDFSAKTLDGNEKSLADFRGQVVLVVNTASKCGFTPQYEGLETLYKDLHTRGFEILGFPCNQFGGQEPGNEQDIGQFCTLNYGVTFPMFAKIDVNGSDAHPLYKFLKEAKKGIAGTAAIKWNFTKFLVDREGNVVERFAPNVKPAEIEPEVTRLL